MTNAGVGLRLKACVKKVELGVVNSVTLYPTKQ